MPTEQTEAANAVGAAWADLANWNGDEWIGPTAPPWGKTLRCSASRSDGSGRCRRPAIAGGTVCTAHGGKAIQVRRKATLRLLELQDPAISVLARIMLDPNAKHTDRVRAANSILDRGGTVRQTSSGDAVKALLAERLTAIREKADKELGAMEATVIEEGSAA